MFDTDAVTGFDWEEGNRDKNQSRHGVSALECEEVFFSRPLLLRADVKHSDREARYYVLGRTQNGRLLFICFALRASLIRVISARDMSRKEKAIYAAQTNP